MASSTDEFRHAPLVDGEIRIVTLLPEKLGDNTIRCVVTHAKMSENPVYECLSYMWGEPSQKTYRIVCNGKDYQVQESLVVALFSLRQDQPRALWIDQICINQTDTPEKSAQVLGMANIYRSASQVVLSLGTPSEEIGDGLGFMIDFLGCYGKDWYMDKNGPFRRAWQTFSSAELHQRLAIPQPDDPRWEGVRHIVGRPCFRRTWIVQEVALARKLKLLFAPGMEMNWDNERITSFQSFIEIVCDRNHNITEEAGLYIGRDMVWVRAMVSLRGLSLLIPDHRSLRLLSLLSTTRTFAVTDPRDKIYGVLSVATDSLSLDIQPDYSKTVGEIYTDASRRLITQIRSLDVLKHVETFKHDDQLPSWVPDWRSQRLEEFSLNESEAISAYRATLDSTVHVRDLGDQTKLGLHGILIDVISMTTSGPLANDAESHSYLVGYGLWWDRALAAVGQSYQPTGESLAVALGRTRIADCKVSDLVNNEHYQIKVKENERVSAPYVGLRSHWATVLRQSLHRQLISTSNGYIGLGPLTADMGDSIFLLRGADVPIVLRKVNDTEFRLIGQCYLHGVMNGEYLTKIQAEKSLEMNSSEIWQDICLV